MPTRRHVLAGLTALSAGLVLPGLPLRAALAAQPAGQPLPRRTIPSSGQQVPVIGMGTADSFDVGDDAKDRDPLREVLRRFFAAGATLIDTAPSYGQAEAVLGDLLAELGLRKQAFLATKIGTSGRDAGLQQFQRSLSLLKTDQVELLQVHNLRDWKTQTALLKELKAQGKTRYTGVTHYLESGHEELAEVVRQVRPDFLQVNYAVNARGAEKTLFPLAQELGVAVLVNRSFDDGRLFGRVKDKALPPWAAQAGITSWAQAFLRFSLSHPAVTAVIPATSRPDRQSDNLRAGYGEPLTAQQRQSLIDLIG